MKKYREVLQFGTFYRLSSPFEGNITAWMAVNEERTLAVIGWYKVLNGANLPYSRIRLQGLKEDICYRISGREGCYFGDELMNIGMITTDYSAGEENEWDGYRGDFDSKVFVISAAD